MSQHDFNVANQGFPAFRADMNNAFGALATNSAGTTEPTTTYAYQYWYDETTNLLKMRNGADDAWITLAFFDQTNDEWEIRSAVIQAVDSAGVSIKTDEGTTRFSISDAGVVSFQNYSFPSADGTSGQVLATNGSGTLSFTSVASDKIEEGNSSVEVVDTGTGYVAVTVDGVEIARFDANGRLGIKTTSPDYPLHVTANSSGQQALFGGINTGTGTENIGGIQLGTTTSDSNRRVWGVKSESVVLGQLGFWVSSDNASSAFNGSMVAAISSSGDFKINSGYGSVATAYGCRAWVNFNGTGTVAIRDSGNVSSITDNGTGDYQVNFTNAMVDDDYAVFGIPSSFQTTNVQCVVNTTGSSSGSVLNNKTTSGVRLLVGLASSGGKFDSVDVNVSIFR